MVTLYADVLFVVNGIMNSLILWIVSKFFRKKIKFLRILTGGLIMAFLHGIFLFTFTLYIHPLIASVFILATGIGVALRPTKPAAFFSMMFTAYIASFTVGGLGMGLFYLTDLPYALSILSSDMTGLGKNLPWYLPVICVLSAYLLIKLVLRLIEHITLKRQVLCPVRISMGEAAVSFDALIDTGHTLREPISKSPVIIAEFDQVKIFLPAHLKILFFEHQENNFFSILSEQASPFDNRLRIIPFTSVGESNGMLIGFKPDKVQVGETASATDAVIAIYNRRLTTDGRYQGLLGPELVFAE